MSTDTLREALERIERWQLPATGKTWPETGAPMSYGAAYGSNGERDYMRAVARAALAQPQQAAPDVLPSEAVTAFAAWLTCRAEAVTMSGHHDAAPAAELVKQFSEHQGWQAPRDIFPHNVKHMPMEAAPAGQAANALRPMTPDQIERHIGPDEGDREAVTAIVREVEAWHDIGRQAPAGQAAAPAKPACKYGDPFCPCQDGDLCHYEGTNPMQAPAAEAVQPEPVTLADVLDALNVFNRPKPSEDDGPWEAGHFIRVDYLPDFINVIAAAWFAAPKAQAEAVPAQAVRLTTEAIDAAWDAWFGAAGFQTQPGPATRHAFARAVERAVWAANGLRGEQ